MFLTQLLTFTHFHAFPEDSLVVRGAAVHHAAGSCPLSSDQKLSRKEKVCLLWILTDNIRLTGLCCKYNEGSGKKKSGFAQCSVIGLTEVDENTDSDGEIVLRSFRILFLFLPYWEKSNKLCASL